MEDLEHFAVTHESMALQQEPSIGHGGQDACPEKQR